MIRATCAVWQLEADPRHAESIVEQLGIKVNRVVSTAGDPSEEPRPSDDDPEVIGDAEELAVHDVTFYRAVVARCNYFVRPTGWAVCDQGSMQRHGASDYKTDADVISHR